MGFARSLFTVSSLTISSRIAGFVRDTLMARFLGASVSADAFFVAQRLPNLFRSLFAEGAFTAAFVPLYAEQSEKEGTEAARLFAGQALAFLLSALIPFSALAILCMPWLITLMAPGFHDDAERYEMAVAFSRITFPYLAFISITALQGGVLNAHGRFGPAAAAPIALNIVMILGLLAIAFFGLPAGETLSWSLLISGAVQALWLAFSCHRAGLSIPLVLPHISTETRKLFKNIGPGALGAGASQINLFLSTILASLLPTGAISYLYYADRLHQLPLGVVGIAVATTLLPILSRQIASGKKEMVRHYTSRAIEFCLLLGLPSAVGLALAGAPIIQTLFEHGAFTHADTIATSHALAAYALSVPAFLLTKVFATTFFARQDVRTPVRFAVISMIVNILVAALLLKPLGHVGIALGASVASWVNAILLFRKLKSDSADLYDPVLRRRVPRLFLSTVGMAAVTFGLLHLVQPWIQSSIFGYEFAGLISILGGSALAYAAFLNLTGAVSLTEIKKTLKGQED